MLAANAESVLRQLPQRLIPVVEDNLIRMPISSEVENSPMRNFYVFSPELQALVARIRAYAANGINRTYLLGGPGSGKTSLSYYYYLTRNRSDDHTSELQSLMRISSAVFCWKKK